MARAHPVPGERSGSITAVLSACGVVVAVQQTMLLPILPELPRYLDSTVGGASWAITATLLAAAVATPTVSRLADMYGKRQMMVVSLAASVLGSALGALATTLPVLVAARALQGVGLALIPVALATMRDVLPPRRLALGVALMSATLAIGAGVGLPLSGLVAERLDWHAIFVLTGVLGLVLIVAVLAVVPASSAGIPGRFDVPGAALLSVALTSLLVALSQGGHWGWLSPATLGLTAGGLVVLALWVPVELRSPDPLLDLRVATDRQVLPVNVAAVLAGFGMFANMLVTTQTLQAPEGTGYGLGLGVLETGLWMVPSAAAFGLMAPVSAWLTNRVGARQTLVVGGLVMGAGYAAWAVLTSSLPAVVAASVVISSGTAAVFAAIPTILMRAVPVSQTTAANGLNVLLRSLGTSSASAVVAAVSTTSAVTVAGAGYPSATALDIVLWLAATASVGVATVVALLSSDGVGRSVSPVPGPGTRPAPAADGGRRGA